MEIQRKIEMAHKYEGELLEMMASLLPYNTRNLLRGTRDTISSVQLWKTQANLSSIERN